jgi:Ran-binding protein 1
MALNQSTHSDIESITSEEEKYNWDEEIENVNPILPEVSINSGEEWEDVIFKERAKLFRWRNGEWKERGKGWLKILRHKESWKIRLVLRQDQTKKPVCNFYVSEDPFCMLKPFNSDVQKMVVFSAYDCSELSDPRVEYFVLKFNSNIILEGFREAFEKAKIFNLCVKNNLTSNLVFEQPIEEEFVINSNDLQEEHTKSNTDPGLAKTNE